MVFLTSYISVTEEGGDAPASDRAEEGEEIREEEVNQSPENEGEKWGMWAHSLISSQGLKLWMSVS